MIPPLRVLIADDEPLAAERLQLLLAQCPGVDLVGTASDGESAVRMAEALTPDLLLLDIAMPGLDGIDVARALATKQTVAGRRLRHRLRPVRGRRVRGRGGRLSDEAGRLPSGSSARSTVPAPMFAAPRESPANAARNDLAMARGILGVGPVRPGPDRRARRRPGVGRARLHAAARRPPKLADPPFDDRARGGARPGAVRPAAPLGDRPQGLHRRLHAQSRRGAGSRALATAPSSRSAGSTRTGSGRSPAAEALRPAARPGERPATGRLRFRMSELALKRAAWLRRSGGRSLLRGNPARLPLSHRRQHETGRGDGGCDHQSTASSSRSLICDAAA